MCSHCSKQFICEDHLLLHQGIGKCRKRLDGQSYVSKPSNSKVPKKDKSKGFVCSLCSDLEFPSAEELLLHLKNGNCAKKLAGHSYVSTPTNSTALEQTNMQMLFGCDLCFSRFTSSDHLLRHQRFKKCAKKLDGHSNVRALSNSKACSVRFTCQVCSSKFRSHEELRAHVEVHGYLCSTCNKHFADTEEFKRHIESHYGVIYLCSVCEQGFLSESNLRKHVDYAHTDKVSHSCHICNECFNTENDLKLHVLTHKGTSELMVPYDLVDRIKRHNGKFVCNICSHQYVRLGTVISHLEVHSNVKDDESCLTCGVEFISRNPRHKHERIHETN